MECICKICGKTVTSTVCERNRHLEEEHPKIQKSKYSFEYFKTIYKELHKGKSQKSHLKKLNRINNTKRKKEHIKQNGKIQQKSIFWKSILVTSFESSRKKH